MSFSRIENETIRMNKKRRKRENKLENHEKREKLRKTQKRVKPEKKNGGKPERGKPEICGNSKNVA